MSPLKRIVAGLLVTASLGVQLVTSSSPASATITDTIHAGLVSAQPWYNTPRVQDGAVKAILRIGDRVFAGGTFTRINNPNQSEIVQPYLFAFSATTGAIDMSFLPTLDKSVEALEAAPDGNFFVSGKFNTVNGETWKRLVKLDAITGTRVTSFNGKVNAGANVLDLAVRGSRLYVAGAFSKISNAARSRLAALNVTTGAIDPSVNLQFTGLHNGGQGRITSIDVSPNDGSLVAIGNFTLVDGQSRDQIALVDLTPTSATLSSWQTTKFVMQCASRFDSYTTDVDIDPTGTYFVVATTGAYSGGAPVGTMCDAASRWELGRTGPDQQPSWVSYTGGDSLFAIASTGSVIYAGGHQRWANNPWRGDALGAGGVVRQGIAALDPLNGMPLTWNPTRTRGRGVQVFYPTSDGLWIGTDTCCIAQVNRARLHFMPLAGGTAVPQPQQAALPTDLFQVPVSTCPGPDPSILYRVNAAGPQLPSLDCGPDWAIDTNNTGQGSPNRNTGSNVATWTPVPTVTPNVPATTPIDVFTTERWDPASLPEMEWNFTVPAATPIVVRIYMANSCTCTDNPGERRFDVRLDGNLVLDNYDEVADVGWRVGTMKSFTTTSDGNVDIDFGHRTEMPLVNAIEIVRTDIAPVLPGNSSLSKRPFDGTAPGALTPVPTPGVDWKQARGSFWANGTLYTAWSDGRFYARSFDGATLGSAREIPLNGLLSGTPTFFPASSFSGMALDQGNMYFSVTGDTNLYYRYFSVESEIIGAQRFNASSNGGVNWGDVRGFTIAGGKMFFVRSDGNLYRIDFASGAPVSGTEALLSGPLLDGIDWRSNGLFVQMPNA